MNQITIIAIVAWSKDHKENDKRLKLLSSSGEVVSCVIKGVKRPNAKLKFASLPFAFCEYTLTKKGDFYSVTGASEIESLFLLTQDIENFTAASIMLEAAEIVARTNHEGQIFTNLLKAYKSILYNGYPVYKAATHYIEFLLKTAGYQQGSIVGTKESHLHELIKIVLTFEKHIAESIKSAQLLQL